jgi:exo-poly-alpha-galacturonosidase
MVMVGSETSGGIRNVEIRDCIVQEGNWAPIRFKSQPSRGGVVENITYRNITIKDARMIFDFNMAWRMVGTIKPPARILPVVRNVRIINVTGNANSGGNITGLEGSPIQNLSFENCTINVDKGLIIQYVEATDFSGLHLTVKSGEAIIKK